MKRTLVLALLAASGVAAYAQPQGDFAFTDEARVRSVEPQYQQVQVPRQQCRTETVVEQRPVGGSGPNYGGLAIGAVVGGLLGNQVGAGHGKEAATAAGAVAGAMVGNNVAGGGYQTQYQQVPREVQRCTTVNEVQNQLAGYRVTYAYRGHEYVTVMQREPGRTIPVRVSVVPMEAEYHRR